MSSNSRSYSIKKCVIHPPLFKFMFIFKTSFWVWIPIPQGPERIDGFTPVNKQKEVSGRGSEKKWNNSTSNASKVRSRWVCVKVKGGVKLSILYGICTNVPNTQKLFGGMWFLHLSVSLYFHTLSRTWGWLFWKVETSISVLYPHERHEPDVRAVPVTE